MHNIVGYSINEKPIDFAAILKASEVLLGIIQLDELLLQFTQIILQNSGADCCSLILPDRNGVWHVQVIATSETTELCSQTLEGNPSLPVKLIEYVKNTQEVVMVDNFNTDLPVIDEYLSQQKPYSQLCLPVINKGHLLGIVYLSSHSIDAVFTSDRILILNFLCTQAAISLENLRLSQERDRAQICFQQNESFVNARYRTLINGASDADCKEDERKQQQLIQELSDFKFALDQSAIVAITDTAGVITYVNERFCDISGYSCDELIGNTHRIVNSGYHSSAFFQDLWSTVTSGNIWRGQICNRNKNGNLYWVESTLIPFLDKQGQPFQYLAIRFDITGRKKAEQTISQQVEQREKLLREITQRIRQSLNLQTIFNTACKEIRQVIQADRVGIFKFNPESNFDNGEFVAESVVKGFSSVIAIRVHDNCFGKNFSSLYSKGRFHAVDNIYSSGLSGCHTDILSQFEVRANLVMPLLCGEQLWGLLCIHQCGTTRKWQQSEIDLTQQLANQLAIGIQQASFYDQIQSELIVRQQAEARIALQLRRQQALGAIIQQIRESLNIDEILSTVTEQVKDIMHCDRVIVLRFFGNGKSTILEESVSDKFPVLKGRNWDNEVWSQEILDCYWQGQPRIVPDVIDDIWTECLVEYSLESQIKSKIVAPILQEMHIREHHPWVASGETNKLWGILVIHACQTKRVWHESEAELLQQIANQLAIAIQQANLFNQLQQELAERQQAQQQLTERNQQLAVSNEELARATRLKDEFLANMSHELRTPLNAILGMSEGLQEKLFGQINYRQLKALQTIEGSASHLLELINDILDVAKIESGQMELDIIPTNVAALCQSSLAFIKLQALKKRIQLQTNLPQELPDLLIDKRRIRQVLINLLNNAVKFTERGSIILEVSLQQPFTEVDCTNNQSQKFLRIAVIDTGIGIALEDIKRLFEPFVQIDSALNRQYTGTGLGLALVKRIVELHGGQVGVTSKLGVGSCFTVDLPCVPSAYCSFQIKTQPELSIEPSYPVEETSNLILLAEDNEANINTVSSYLRAKGYCLLLAKNGQEAVALAKSEAPELILMDIQMTGMDGIEAIQEIRRNPNLASVPIIALTALAMKGDRERCLAAGANDYLSKPVKLKQLTSTIEKLLALGRRPHEESIRFNH
ncbi:MAG: GAF domain-containing protein [Nostocales cyanobacterium 94392]|nr:GAF domain-containing protein [Nostocales cyanobacterium 94392]